MKWGEYSSDVQFILQRSEQQKTTDPKQTPQISKTEDVPATTSTTAISIQPLDRNRDVRKSFGSTDSKPPENVGIVKGVPQILPTLHQYHQSPPPTSPPHHSPNNSIISNENPNSSTNTTTPPKQNEFNSADVRNSLDRKTNLFRENSSDESLIDVYSTRTNELYKTGPPISSNGALVPPPYRDPPPPRASPLHQKSDSFSKMFEYKVSS